MCILFIQTDPSPQPGGYRLVVASNRDEFYARPARSAFLCPETGIIGGRDMTSGREGGMWLGVTVKKPSSKIVFAALLNAKDNPEKQSEALPRGPIVLNCLANSHQSIYGYVNTLKSPKLFNPFNLVTVELSRENVLVVHHSNSPEDTLTYEGRQILGFGNTRPGKPLVKVQFGLERFQKIIENSSSLTKEGLVEQLLDLMKSKHRNLPDKELEKCVPTAFDQLSSIFVETNVKTYGTRTHSLLLVDYDYNLEFIEYTMKEPIDINNVQWERTVIKDRLV